MKRLLTAATLLFAAVLLADAVRAQDTNPCPLLPQTKLRLLDLVR